MQSIPQEDHARNRYGDEAPKGTSRKRTDHPQESLQGFHYSALHAVTGYNYLTRKWLPLIGPNAYALIQVLRSHCFFNPETGEVRDSCFPELQTIAREMGVSRSKVCRLLKRDSDGFFIRYDRNTHTWVRWELNRFILVEHRWREMKRPDDQKRTVQTSNRYYIALDDPPTPEDEARVAEKQQELDALAAMKAAQEAARQERVRAAGPPAERFSSASQHDTLRGESKRDAKGSPKMTRQNHRPVTEAVNTDTHRSDHEGESGAAAIRNGHAASQVRPEGYEASEQYTTNPHRIEYRNEEKTSSARAARLPIKGPGKAPPAPSERDIAIDQANEIAGGVVYSNLAGMGDTNPGVGTRIILEALVDAGAPPEIMGALADLGKRRMQRFQYRGGRVINRPGFYTNTMRNLATEAKHCYWKVEEIETKDRRNHERAIQATEAKRQQQQFPYRYQ